MLAKKFRLQIQEWFAPYLNLSAGLKEKRNTITRKSDFFIVKFRANDLLFSRFGTVISAKVSKGAVKRNKIKRIIFDFIRLNKYYKMPGKDALIIVLPKIIELKKNEIEKEIEIILQ
ncbi:MAG: ribonuclease P protein component [Patescibacteria group bacterium]